MDPCWRTDQAKGAKIEHRTGLAVDWWLAVGYACMALMRAPERDFLADYSVAWSASGAKQVLFPRSNLGGSEMQAKQVYWVKW